MGQDTTQQGLSLGSLEAHIGYAALRWVFRGILRLGFGLAVIGEQYIPLTGPVILAPNHRSDIDPIVMAAAVPRRCTFLAAAELLTRPVLGPLIRPFRVVSIRRGRFDRGAIEECLRRLARNEALVVFPEGTIGPGGCPQPAQDGLSFIAIQSHVPIVPVAITGTHEIWPSGARLPRRGTITVHFGRTIVPTPAATRRDQSALTTHVMEAITKLMDSLTPRTFSTARPYTQPRCPRLESFRAGHH